MSTRRCAGFSDGKLLFFAVSLSGCRDFFIMFPTGNKEVREILVDGCVPVIVRAVA